MPEQKFTKKGMIRCEICPSKNIYFLGDFEFICFGQKLLFPREQWIIELVEKLLYNLLKNIAGPWNWLHDLELSHLLQTWPPHGATWISSKSYHHLARLEMVANLSTRWRHLPFASRNCWWCIIHCLQLELFLIPKELPCERKASMDLLYVQISYLTFQRIIQQWKMKMKNCEWNLERDCITRDW